MTTKEAIKRYCSEYLRTTGKTCVLAYCGGGWYTLHIEGDTVQPKIRWQKRQIMDALHSLGGRPDFVA